MTITLVRPLDVDPALVAAVLAALAPAAPAAADEAVECLGCYATAPDEDTARDDLGWVVDEDHDALVCESCATFDGASGAYDRAYWG
jgi:hypothetical protein